MNTRTAVAWGLGAFLALVGLIILSDYVASFKSVDQGEACIVKEGGPFDGKAVIDVRQPGEGREGIGLYNDQLCLPASERDWVLSSSADDSDNDQVDQISVPTRDAVNLFVEGQAIWTLNTDEDQLKAFYKKFGKRKWDGESITTDQGFLNFQRIRMRPVLVDTLRNVTGTFDCVNLNNLCAYVQDAETTLTDAEKGQEKVKNANNAQNLNQAKTNISEQLANNLNDALGGDFFTGVRFQNLKYDFSNAQKQKIEQAQTKRTEVATAKLEADRLEAKAEGEKRAEHQKALARLEARKGYRNNPVQAEIDKIRAFCGETKDGLSKGCNPQVLGGSDIITNLGK